MALDKGDTHPDMLGLMSQRAGYTQIEESQTQTDQDQEVTLSLNVQGSRMDKGSSVTGHLDQRVGYFSRYSLRLMCL